MQNTYKFQFFRKVASRIFVRINFFIDTTQPTFQRRFNVASTSWITVGITLIRRWKRKKIRSRIFSVAQHWYNVGIQRWNNVKSTLHTVDVTIFQSCATSFQRCFNVDMTLSQCCFNMAYIYASQSYIETNLASEKYRFVKSLRSFILLNEKIFFTIYQLFNY